MQLAGLPQNRNRIRRIRADQNAFCVGRFDFHQLSTKVRRALRVCLLQHHCSVQLGETCLERRAAADSTLIVDVNDGNFAQGAIAIEIFREYLAAQAAGGNAAKNEFAGARKLGAGRGGADQNRFAGFGERRKRQGHAAAYRAQDCRWDCRRACSCHDLVERGHAFGRAAPIICNDERELPTANAARAIDFLDRQLRPVARRDSPVRRVSRQWQHHADADGVARGCSRHRAPVHGAADAQRPCDLTNAGASQALAHPLRSRLVLDLAASLTRG